MRSPAEINQAISYLKGKGGRIAEEQIRVLSKQMTESQVFQTYVVNVGEENKDEALYFATREAAQYLAGKLTIEELIPGYETVVPVEDVTIAGRVVSDTMTLSLDDFKTLLKRLDDQEQRIRQLEKWTGKKRTAYRRDRDPMPIGVDQKNMLNQRTACTYLGIGKNTIKKYADMGLLSAYQYGRYVYYSKKELERLKNNK